MAAKNDITGDSIQTRGITDAYRDNYELIFGKKKKSKSEREENVEEGSVTEDAGGESSDGGVY